jgi:hypothetical protein
MPSIYSDVISMKFERVKLPKIENTYAINEKIEWYKATTEVNLFIGVGKTTLFFTAPYDNGGSNNVFALKSIPVKCLSEITKDEFKEVITFIEKLLVIDKI